MLIKEKRKRKGERERKGEGERFFFGTVIILLQNYAKSSKWASQRIYLCIGGGEWGSAAPLPFCLAVTSCESYQKASM
jgi:hypothetical protein